MQFVVKCKGFFLSGKLLANTTRTRRSMRRLVAQMIPWGTTYNVVIQLFITKVFNLKLVWKATSGKGKIICLFQMKSMLIRLYSFTLPIHNYFSKFEELDCHVPEHFECKSFYFVFFVLIWKAFVLLLLFLSLSKDSGAASEHNEDEDEAEEIADCRTRRFAPNGNLW